MAQQKNEGLAKVEPTKLALAVMDPEQAVDLGAFHEELGIDASELGMSIFTRIKMPSGGGRAWEIENPDNPDAPEITPVIEGIIVATRLTNGYWSRPMGEGETNAPDCSSNDSVTGNGKRWAEDADTPHDCATCPLNEFGSSDTGGKACKNMRQLFVLREGDILPLLITLPPTSLKAYQNYVAKSIVMQRRRSFAVVTKIGLEKVGDGGTAYSRATFAFGGMVSPEQAAFLRDYGAQIAAITEQVPAIVVDPEAGARGGSVIDEDPF